MKTNLWILPVGLITCLILGLTAALLGQSASATSANIAQIEAQRTLHQVISGAQVVNALLIGVILLLLVLVFALGIALIVAKRQPPEQLPGGWTSGPNARWERKTQPQLTQAQLLQLMLLQQAMQNGQQLPGPARLQRPADEESDWFEGTFG